MDNTFKMDDGTVFWLYVRTNHDSNASLWTRYGQTFPSLAKDEPFVHGRIRLYSKEEGQDRQVLGHRFAQLLSEPMLARFAYSTIRAMTDGSLSLIFPLQSVQARAVGRKVNMKRALQLILNHAANEMDCDYVCYLVHPAPVTQFHEAEDALTNFFDTVTAPHNSVIIVDEFSSPTERIGQEEPSRYKLDMILRGERDRFLKEVEKEVYSQLGDVYEAKAAFQLSMDYSQLFHVALYECGISSSCAFYDPKNISKEDTIHSRKAFINTVKKQLDLTLNAIEQKQSEDSLLGQIQQYIQDHLTEDLSRETIAKQFFLHPDYLSHYFHKYSDRNLAAYIRNLRIQKAQRLLLSTTLPISEVAVQVGYSSSTYFTKAFIKETGVKPSEYRARKKKQRP